MKSPRYWLALGAALWTVAAAAQPPAPPAGQQATPPTKPSSAPPPPADGPDDEFIEFLGEEDHGDAAWWEMVKKAQAGKQSPAPPPQSPRQW